MVLLYACVGVFLIISEISIAGFSDINKRLFGILLIIYSIYRGFRFWQKYFKVNKEGEE
jgi:hypothetical protein